MRTVPPSSPPRSLGFVPKADPCRGDRARQPGIPSREPRARDRLLHGAAVIRCADERRARLFVERIEGEYEVDQPRALCPSSRRGVGETTIRLLDRFPSRTAASASIQSAVSARITRSRSLRACRCNSSARSSGSPFRDASHWTVPRRSARRGANSRTTALRPIPTLAGHRDAHRHRVGGAERPAQLAELGVAAGEAVLPWLVNREGRATLPTSGPLGHLGQLERRVRPLGIADRPVVRQRRRGIPLHAETAHEGAVGPPHRTRSA